MSELISRRTGNTCLARRRPKHTLNSHSVTLHTQVLGRHRWELLSAWVVSIFVVVVVWTVSKTLRVWNILINICTLTCSIFRSCLRWSFAVLVRLASRCSQTRTCTSRRRDIANDSRGTRWRSGALLTLRFPIYPIVRSFSTTSISSKPNQSESNRSCVYLDYLFAYLGVYGASEHKLIQWIDYRQLVALAC